MKKILLSITAICAALTINAQVLSASVADDFTTWSSVDVDGDTYEWGIYTVTGYETFGEMLLSSSWIGPGAGTDLTPDNVVISPEITSLGTATNVTLTFKAGSPEPLGGPYQAEKYSVYVLTTAEIATIIATGTFPTPVFTKTASGGGFENETVDISTQAAGQTSVYIAFRHYDCTGQNFLMLDDILVNADFASVEENNLQVLSVYPNPATDVLNISLNEEVAMVTIYSLDGKIVLNEVVNNSLITLEVSNLEAGMYFYEVSTKNGEKIRNSFIKQ